jgi:hypothetical protein
VVEESIASVWHEEDGVHHTVDDLFESLREDRVCAWLRVKNKCMKAAASQQITMSSRFASAGSMM